MNVAFEIGANNFELWNLVQQLIMGLRVVKQNKGMEPIIMVINFVPLSLLMVMEP
jgi:hypothetical protein